MGQLWQWILWPVRFVDGTVLSGEPGMQGASWPHVLGLSLASFVFFGIVLLAMAVFGYLVLPLVDRAVERLLR